MTAPTPDEAAALIRVAERQLDLWKAECRALEAERDVLRRDLAAAHEDVERLRGRTHEIQAEEMTKRAALDSELADWRRRYEEAKAWTEDAGVTAEWAEDPLSPFWRMTSYNARSALLRLVAERNDARAQLAAARPVLDAAEGVRAVGGDDLLRVMPATAGRLWDALAAYRAAMSAPAEVGATGSPEPVAATFRARAEDLNRVAQDLADRYGFLPLSVRYRMADTILDQQERNRAAGLAEAGATEPAPDAVRARRYSVTFDDLFHVPSFCLSWRCDLGGSRVDPGYVDGACRYDHNVDSWGQLAAEADEHLARWHPHIRALPNRLNRAAEAAHAAMFEGDLPLDGIERELWRNVVRAVLVTPAAEPADDTTQGTTP